MSKEKIRLNIVGLSFTQTQSIAYVLILAEQGGNRRMPVIIGGIEAQSIAIKLEGLTPPRPLTHDLFMNFARSFSINLVEVFIYKVEEGIFYSELVFAKGRTIMRIDSRTSDAVALAVRFNCPIYTYEDILDKASVVFDPNATKKATGRKGELSGKISAVSYKDLKIMLKEAIEAENYEMASIIRDEIKRREEK